PILGCVLERSTVPEACLGCGHSPAGRDLSHRVRAHVCVRVARTQCAGARADATMFRMRALTQLALIVCLAVSCASPATSTTGTSPPPPTLQTETRTASPAPSETPVPNPAHVFVIVMENATLATALRSPTVERH